MNGLHVGESAAVGTALLWTLSALAWTAAGRRVGALAVSFVRLLITCVFLSVHGTLARGLTLPTDAPPETWKILAISGFVGFFVSDLFLFKAFLLIGPRLSLLIYSLTPPLATLMAWSLFGQPLAPHGWLAMAVTLAGVGWVVAEQPAEDSRPVQQRLGAGLAYALSGAVWQALAAVLSQRGIGEYDAVAGTYIRVLGGLAGYIPLVFLLRRWPAMLSTVRNPQVLSILTAGALVGPYLGVTLYLVALRHCHAGVVTTITATMPVLILPFSIFLHRERVTLRAALGAALSVLGVALLVW